MKIYVLARKENDKVVVRFPNFKDLTVTCSSFDEVSNIAKGIIKSQNLEKAVELSLDDVEIKEGEVLIVEEPSSKFNFNVDTSNINFVYVGYLGTLLLIFNTLFGKIGEYGSNALIYVSYNYFNLYSRINTFKSFDIGLAFTNKSSAPYGKMYFFATVLIILGLVMIAAIVAFIFGLVKLNKNFIKIALIAQVAVVVLILVLQLLAMLIFGSSYVPSLSIPSMLVRILAIAIEVFAVIKSKVLDIEDIKKLKNIFSKGFCSINKK